MHILKGRFLSVEVTLEYKIKPRSTDKSLKKNDVAYQNRSERSAALTKLLCSVLAY